MHSLQVLSFEPDLQSLSATAVYAVVFGFVFVESGLLVGFFLPGDTVLFTAGLLAARPGSGLSLWLLTAGVFVAAVTGDGVGYASGARLGRPWLQRRADAGRLNPAHLARAEAFYARFGMLSVVGARWIPWLRTLTPVLAGASDMPYRRFLTANVAGALTWGAGLIMVGYVAHSHPAVRSVAYAVAGTSVALSVVALGLGLVRRRRAQTAGDPEPGR